MECSQCGKENGDEFSPRGGKTVCKYCGKDNSHERYLSLTWIKANGGYKDEKDKKELDATIKKLITKENKKDKNNRIEWFEIFMGLILPAGVFIYLVTCTDLQRYVALIGSLLIPSVIKIRGRD